MTAAHSFPPVLLYADFETRNNESGISYPNLSITCWNAKNSRFREITLLDHVVSLKIISISVVRGLTVHWKAVENGMLIKYNSKIHCFGRNYSHHAARCLLVDI